METARRIIFAELHQGPDAVGDDRNIFFQSQKWNQVEGTGGSVKKDDRAVSHEGGGLFCNRDLFLGLLQLPEEKRDPLPGNVVVVEDGPAVDAFQKMLPLQRDQIPTDRRLAGKEPGGEILDGDFFIVNQNF